MRSAGSLTPAPHRRDPHLHRHWPAVANCSPRNALYPFPPAPHLRPTCDPFCSQEYGLPSSHTLNTLCLNFFVCWYCYDRGLVGGGAALAAYAATALWVSVFVAK